MLDVSVCYLDKVVDLDATARQVDAKARVLFAHNV